MCSSALLCLHNEAPAGAAHRPTLHHTPGTTDKHVPACSLQKKALQSREDLVSIIESNGVSQPAGAPAAAAEPDGDERLSSEARRFLKDELLEQQRARTKELVDAAWQSLE